MVTIKVKHINLGSTRDFNGLSYKSEVRAKWIRENQDKYITVAEVTYLYATRQKAMNLAYEDTNSINEYWVDAIKYRFADVAEQDRVKVYPAPAGMGGYRSTSVGDIFTICTDDKEVDYFVDSYGFTPVAEDAFIEEV